MPKLWYLSFLLMRITSSSWPRLVEVFSTVFLTPSSYWLQCSSRKSHKVVLLDLVSRKHSRCCWSYSFFEIRLGSDRGAGSEGKQSTWFVSKGLPLIHLILSQSEGKFGGKSHSSIDRNKLSNESILHELRM